MTPLTDDEKSLVEQYYPLLQKVAKRTAPRRPEEATSAGYDGLVEAIRTWDATGGCSLNTWVTRHVKYRVLDWLRSEKRHVVEALPADIEDTRETHNPLWDVLECLPAHLKEVAEAYIRVGSIEATVYETGLPIRRVRRYLDEIKEIGMAN